LTGERDELLRSVDANASELHRVRQVMRGVSEAHKIVSQHAQRLSDSSGAPIVPTPIPTNRAAEFFRTTTAASQLQIPSASAGALDMTSTTSPTTSINVRHHPNGHLSLDLGPGISVHHTPMDIPSVPTSTASATARSQHNIPYTPIIRHIPRVHFTDSKAHQ
jgi:hypothetical protein